MGHLEIRILVHHSFPHESMLKSIKDGGKVKKEEQIEIKGKIKNLNRIVLNLNKLN